MAVITSRNSEDCKRYPSMPGGWRVARHQFTGTPTVNDCFEMFGANLQGYYIDDWWVSMDQVDSNGAPTVTWDIGLINSGGTAIQTIGGFQWASGVTTLGRTARPSRVRDVDSVCQTWPGSGNRIGLCMTTGAATAAFTNKWVRMGLLLCPM